MLKVLIVDDSLIIRKNLRKMLEALGHAIIAEAKNGLEAVNHYNAHQPDLVTMDITMPEMDGIEAVGQIYQKDRDAKIIMITSHGQEEKVIQSVQAGASGYILKPFDEKRLGEAIGKLFPRVVKDEYYNMDEPGEIIITDD